ncbi:MAG TPA: SIMPL domain-containing protein [Aestuariivirgaceae bacterium]|nr:SIMPL domain-containing protein [Aestuariivirgaceae bacterium]
MRTSILASLMLALWLAPVLAAVPAAAQQPEPHRKLTPGLTLVGVGEVRASPDLAVVRVGVVSQAATARAALDANNQAMRAVMATLQDRGIAERDMQTSQFSVQPRYRHDQTGQAPPRIDVYEVSNQLAVTVRDLEALGPVLDQAVSVGSNQILGIEFDLADPEPRRDEARRLAVEDAMRKANVYAEAADVELGPIRAMTEQARFDHPQPYQRMEMAQSSVPIAEGEQVVAVEVTITWDIGLD